MDSQGLPTTLMIRNLPPHVTPPCLIEDLNKCGFEGAYDFVYVPRNFTSCSNTGFAFINFMDPQDGVVFTQQWQRRQGPGFLQINS